MGKIDYSIDDRIDRYEERSTSEYAKSCSLFHIGHPEDAMMCLQMSVSYLRLELRYRHIKIRRNHCGIN